MAAKTLKNPYRLQTMTFKEEGEENKNTERKTKSYVFSDFGDGISRGLERNSTAGRFAIGNFGRVPEGFLLSVWTKLIIRILY